MAEYHRLTHEEKYQIEAFLSSGVGKVAIAKRLGKHRSTIYREIARGRVCRKAYSAQVAERLAKVKSRGRHEKRKKIRGWLRAYIERALRLDWSPEQIAGRLKLEKKSSISAQSIYRFLERDKLAGGDLWRHLRILRRERKDRKKANWRAGTSTLRGRVPLEKRPKVVEKRKRIGDYERDTVFGKHNGAFLLTIVDRVSRLSKLALVKKKSAQLVHQATIACLRRERVSTITNDNGTEFARHAETANALKARVYFSHAYRSWERGTNENTNGLIRQYFPRKRAISSRAKVKRVERLLNHRPRKCLGFYMPAEIHKRKSVSH